MNRFTPWGVFLGLVSFSINASAYEFLETDDGQALAWTSTRADHLISSDVQEELRAAVRTAFDTWNQVIEPSLDLHYAGLHLGNARDGVSATHLLQIWDASFGDESRTVAHTRIVYDVQTGTITEADILLNGAGFRFDSGSGNGDPGAFDLQSVVLHEIGHFIGLAHSCGEAGRQYPSCFSVDKPRILNAVMAPTLSIGTLRRSLGQDDLDGLAARFSNIRAGGGPVVVSVASDCEGESVVIQLESPPINIQVMLRDEAGVLTELLSRSASDSRLLLDAGAFDQNRSVDVLLRDQDSGAYSVVYDFQPVKPVNCGDLSQKPSLDQDEIPAENCACRDTAALGKTSLVVLLFVVLLLAIRLARARKIAMVLLFGIASAPSAEAYRCTRVEFNVGPSLIWADRQIEWVLSDTLTDDIMDSTEVVDIVSRAFQSWSSPECTDLSFVFGGQKPGLQASFTENGPHENAVVFVGRGWIHGAGVVALTSNAFDRGSGVIFDTDIEINDEFFLWTDAATSTCTMGMDLENALTHEVGHFIGLSHPPNTAEFRDSTMFAVANPCETQKRTLAQDDIDGVCAIYPKGKATQQCHPPEGPSFVQAEKDLGYGCQASGSGGRLSFLFLLLYLFRKRRGCS